MVPMNPQGWCLCFQNLSKFDVRKFAMIKSGCSPDSVISGVSGIMMPWITRRLGTGCIVLDWRNFDLDAVAERLEWGGWVWWKFYREGAQQNSLSTGSFTITKSLTKIAYITVHIIIIVKPDCKISATVAHFLLHATHTWHTGITGT